MAAATTRAEKQQGDISTQTAAPSFDAMHGELASQAHAVGRDFGVDVVTVAFCPDGGADGVDVGAGIDDAPIAVSHEFLGVAPTERVRRLVAADASAMGPAELAMHAARLRAVRAALVREMQGTEKDETKQGAGGQVDEVAGTTPGRKEMPSKDQEAVVV